MRWVYTSIILGVLLIAGIATDLGIQNRRLQAFCQELGPGRDVVQVRKSAQVSGFKPRMEPFSQMRIESPHWGWHLSPPSCRVFFNQERTVEYRVWQNS